LLLSAVGFVHGACDWKSSWRTEHDKKYSLYEFGIGFKRNDGVMYQTLGNDLVDMRNGVRGSFSADCSVVHWSNCGFWSRVPYDPDVPLETAQDRQAVAVNSCFWEGTWRTDSDDKLLIRADPDVPAGYLNQGGSKYMSAGEKLISMPVGHQGTMEVGCNVLYWGNGSYWARMNQDGGMMVPMADAAAKRKQCPWDGSWRTDRDDQYSLHKECNNHKRNDGVVYETSGRDVTEIRSGVRGLIDTKDCNVVLWSNGAYWARVSDEGTLLVSMEEAGIRSKMTEVAVMSCRWEGPWIAANNTQYALQRDSNGWRRNDGVMYLTFSIDLVDMRTGVRGSMDPSCNTVHWSYGMPWIRASPVQKTVTEGSAAIPMKDHSTDVQTPSSSRCQWVGSWKTETDNSEYKLKQTSVAGNFERNDGVTYQLSGDELVHTRSGVKGTMWENCNTVHWSNGVYWSRSQALPPAMNTTKPKPASGQLTSRGLRAFCSQELVLLLSMMFSLS